MHPSPIPPLERQLFARTSLLEPFQAGNAFAARPKAKPGPEKNPEKGAEAKEQRADEGSCKARSLIYIAQRSATPSGDQ